METITDIYPVLSWHDRLKMAFARVAEVITGESCTAGDEYLFNEIIASYGGMINRICFYYTSSRTSYDDLRQDVLINIWRGLPHFREQAQRSTWIYRICLNTCITGWRREKKRSNDVPIDLINDITDNDTTEQIENIEMLHHLISLLSPTDKALIMMHLDGMTYEEIAETTGYPRNTVATRLHRIRNKMKQSFSDNL